MIQRPYTDDGLYNITLTGTGKRRLKSYLKGGNCGCSNCLTGSGFFDDVANFFEHTGADIVSLVPEVGGPIATAWRNGIPFIRGLSGDSHHTIDPTYSGRAGEDPRVKPIAQSASKTYVNALNRSNQRLKGRGVFEFFDKHKSKIKNAVKLAGLAHTLYSGYKAIPKKKVGSGIRAKKIKGKGIKEFYNKHKTTIKKVGKTVAGLAGLAGLAYLGHKPKPAQYPLFSGPGFD